MFSRGFFALLLPSAPQYSEVLRIVGIRTRDLAATYQEMISRLPLDHGGGRCTVGNQDFFSGLMANTNKNEDATGSSTRGHLWSEEKPH